LDIYQNIGYLYLTNMRPDYSHKIFGDKRLHHFFFQQTLARASASAWLPQWGCDFCGA
jgi:hypothetical protein